MYQIKKGGLFMATAKRLPSGNWQVKERNCIPQNKHVLTQKHEERKEFPYEKKFSKYESYCFCQKRRRHQNWSCTNDATTSAAKTTAALINRIPAYDLYNLDTLPYRKI